MPLFFAGVPEISASVENIMQNLQQLGAGFDQCMPLPLFLSGCMADNVPTREFFKSRLQSSYQVLGDLDGTCQAMEDAWANMDVGGPGSGHLSRFEPALQRRIVQLLLI